MKGITFANTAGIKKGLKMLLTNKIDLNTALKSDYQKKQKVSISFTDCFNNIEKEIFITDNNATSVDLKKIKEIGIYNYANELHKKDLEKKYYKEVLEELGLTEETFKKLCNDNRIPGKLLYNLKQEIKAEVERRVEEQIKKEMLLSLSEKTPVKKSSTHNVSDGKTEIGRAHV